MKLFQNQSKAQRISSSSVNAFVVNTFFFLFDFLTSLDKELQMKVLLETNMTPLAIREVPQSHKDFVLNFTREERLAMYEYVIQQTGHFEQPESTFL